MIRLKDTIHQGLFYLFFTSRRWDIMDMIWYNVLATESSHAPKKNAIIFDGNQGQTAVAMSRVFLLHQLWIVNYYVKSLSNNLSNENINTGVSVVFVN